MGLAEGQISINGAWADLTAMRETVWEVGCGEAGGAAGNGRQGFTTAAVGWTGRGTQPAPASRPFAVAAMAVAQGHAWDEQKNGQN